jgi:hypothetical protein
MSSTPPVYRRCEETRAHYAHEWYNPLTTFCPGGPDETVAEASGSLDYDRLAKALARIKPLYGDVKIHDVD